VRLLGTQNIICVFSYVCVRPSDSHRLQHIYYRLRTQRPHPHHLTVHHSDSVCPCASTLTSYLVPASCHSPRCASPFTIARSLSSDPGYHRHTPHRYPIHIRTLSPAYISLSITMCITPNLSFVLLALVAGAIAFPANPAPDPVKSEVTPLETGVSSHTFSPPFFFLICHAPFANCCSPFTFSYC